MNKTIIKRNGNTVLICMILGKVQIQACPRHRHKEKERTKWLKWILGKWAAGKCQPQFCTCTYKEQWHTCAWYPTGTIKLSTLPLTWWPFGSSHPVAPSQEQRNIPLPAYWSRWKMENYTRLSPCSSPVFTQSCWFSLLSLPHVHPPPPCSLPRLQFSPPASHPAVAITHHPMEAPPWVHLAPLCSLQPQDWCFHDVCCSHACTPQCSFMVKAWSPGPLHPHLPHPASQPHIRAVLQLVVTFSSPCVSLCSASFAWNIFAVHPSFFQMAKSHLPIGWSTASARAVNCLPSGR